jgi:hypothetical protein
MEIIDYFRKSITEKQTRKSTYSREEKLGQNFDAASGTIFKIIALRKCSAKTISA